MRNRKLFLNYIEKKGGIVKKLQQILLLTDSAQNEEKKVLSMMLAVIMFTSTSFCSIANELEDKGNADGIKVVTIGEGHEIVYYEGITIEDITI